VLKTKIEKQLPDLINLFDNKYRLMAYRVASLDVITIFKYRTALSTLASPTFKQSNQYKACYSCQSYLSTKYLNCLWFNCLISAGKATLTDKFNAA